MTTFYKILLYFCFHFTSCWQIKYTCRGNKRFALSPDKIRSYLNNNRLLFYPLGASPDELSALDQVQWTASVALDHICPRVSIYTTVNSDLNLFYKI